MKKALTVLFLVAVVLLAVGCSKTYSYDYSSWGYCYEVTTSDGALKTALELTWDEAACPTDATLGTCEQDYGAGYDATQTVYYYEDGYYDTVEEAQEDCEFYDGTWTAS